MKITRENCEVFFLDYYEGNLSAAQARELFAFLVIHPDLREIFDSYEHLSLEPETKIIFETKEDLKRTDDLITESNSAEENFEENAVAYLDQALPPEAAARVELLAAQDPAKKKTLEQFAQTILTPENIVFEGKALLRKQEILVHQNNFSEMAAAYAEGLLNAAETEALHAYAVAHGKLEELELYRKARFEPETDIVYVTKDSLKRKAGGFIWYQRYAVAAAIALLFGIFWLSNRDFVSDKNSGEDLAGNSRQNNSGPVIGTKNTDKDGNRVDKTADATPLLTENKGEKHYVANFPENKISSGNDSGIIHETENVAFAALRTIQVKNIPSNLTARLEISNAFNQDEDLELPDESTVQLGSNSVSLMQAGMRWAKKKLDRRPDEHGEDAYVVKRAHENNDDVSGFDLTSSAVDRFSFATGTNVHLKKSDDGTLLVLGKYDLMLSRAK
ncbi:MAG TPA: hypothetical protein VI731_07270 [Bacteroidia bacterium]|nr:hypothetical protein [Bacteroidia bacterium]